MAKALNIEANLERASAFLLAMFQTRHSLRSQVSGFYEAEKPGVRLPH